MIRLLPVIVIAGITAWPAAALDGGANKSTPVLVTAKSGRKTTFPICVVACCRSMTKGACGTERLS